MPELPEVETARRGIWPLLRTKVVTAVTVRQPRLRQPVPLDLQRILTGQQLRGLRRRGKYLLFDFPHGGLIVHLGMSGSLRVVPQGAAAQKHDHVDIVFDHAILRYHDPRRFGLMLWQTGDVLLHPLLASLGIEPLAETFNGSALRQCLGQRCAAIKPALMDSHRIAGIGNIYASESLFVAGIHPLRSVSGLSVGEYDQLAQAVQKILRQAIEAGGSSLRDFIGADGKSGYFQNHHYVYERAGKPCLQCGQSIEKMVQGQRATYWCPHCQPEAGSAL